MTEYIDIDFIKSNKDCKICDHINDYVCFDCESIQVKEKYPNEVARLKEEVKVGEVVFSSPDWEHGFNSGVLAAMRFVYTAFDDTTEIMEETGEEVCFGGVENAFDTFPQLDT